MGTGVAVVLVLKGTGLDDSSQHRTVPPAIDVALGGALLVLAVVVARRPRRPPKADTNDRKQRSAVGLYLFGAAMYIPSIFYLTALHEISQGEASGAQTALSLILIALIVLLFVEVPLLLYVAAPDRTARILGSWNGWLSREARTILVVAAAVIGAYLLVSGIVDLVNRAWRCTVRHPLSRPPRRPLLPRPAPGSHQPSQTAAAPRRTPAERAERGKAARREVPRESHADYESTSQRPDPIGIIEGQSAKRVPELIPIRYGRMSESPFRFYRGAAAIMASDLAATPQTGIRAQLCGDAHMLNFRLLASPERNLMFDINDFDETLYEGSKIRSLSEKGPERGAVVPG